MSELVDRPTPGALLSARPPRPPLPAIGARRRVAPGKVLAVASLGAGLAFVDATIVNVAFPDMRADFAGDVARRALLDPERLQHRLRGLPGRRRAASPTCSAGGGRSSRGSSLFTLASVACAAAPTVELLVAARVLQALGAAITVPASLALVLEAYPPAERAHGVALWTAAAALAAGLGPVGRRRARRGRRLAARLPGEPAARHRRLTSPAAGPWWRAAPPAAARCPTCRAPGSPRSRSAR